MKIDIEIDVSISIDSRSKVEHRIRLQDFSKV